MSAPNEFHLREYGALRDEILEKSRQIDQAIRLMLIGVPALMSWIIIEGGALGPAEQAVAAWLPLIAASFFAGYRKDLITGIKKIAIYLRKLEDTYRDENLGWEHRHSEDAILKGQDSFTSAKMVVVATIMMTVAFGVWRTVFYALAGRLGG